IAARLCGAMRRARHGVFLVASQRGPPGLHQVDGRGRLCAAGQGYDKQEDPQGPGYAFHRRPHLLRSRWRRSHCVKAPEAITPEWRASSLPPRYRTSVGTLRMAYAAVVRGLASMSTLAKRTS